LARQVSCFNQLPALVLLGSWAEEIDDEGRYIGEVRPETEPKRLAEILPHRNPFVHSSMMMRTALVQRLGGYRQAFLGSEDLDLSHAEKRLAYRAMFNLLVPRRRPEGLSLGSLTVMVLVLLVGRPVYQWQRTSRENAARRKKLTGGKG